MQDKELLAERDRINRAHRLEIAQLKQQHKIDSMKTRQQLSLDLTLRQREIENKKANEKTEVEVRISIVNMSLIIIC